jgi:hypothetical protein
MPLSLSDEEKDLLLALAQPIDQRLRPEFLAAVAQELEAAAAPTGVGPGLACCIESGASFRGNISPRRNFPTPRRAPGLKRRA